MATRRRGLIQVVKDTINGFIDDDCLTMAAALSYYTVFSLPLLLVLLLTILGALLDPQDMRGNIEAQIRSAMGPAGAEPDPHDPGQRRSARRQFAAAILSWSPWCSARPACSASCRRR